MNPENLSPSSARGVTSFLAGGGEMGQRIRDFDWSKTSLGPSEAWPQSLKTAVRIMLSSRQPIWIGWGPDLHYLYNDPYQAIIGGRHPAALGKPTRDVWPELWDVIGPMLSNAMQGVEGTYVEEQLLIMERHGYREETYYTFSYTPVPDDSGETGGIICANTDDTQRVVGERRLAALRVATAAAAAAQRPEQACERMAEALQGFLHDVPFALLYLAKADAPEARLVASVGLAHGSDAAPESVSLVLETGGCWPLWKAMEPGAEPQPISLELNVPGAPWPEPVNTALILPLSSGAQEKPFGFLVAGTSPRRPLDDDYEGFFDLLAGAVARGIANARAFAEEKRRAEALAELDRAKTTFFSNVSHELRTPLTLMLGPIEEELRQQPGGNARLELAHRNSLRLLKLVNTLLDFSRIEAGRIDAIYEPTELAGFTMDLASGFRSAIEGAGLTLSVEAEFFAEPVFVDRGMWEKIVLNLLSNAFKFTLDGGITLRLKSAAPGLVELEVADTGAGIPEEQLPHLFERFYRVPNTPSRSHEGTGIGLALVQELVRLHDGGITVQSVEGRGSVFKVSIKTGSAHLPPERIGRSSAPRPKEAGAHVYIDEVSRWSETSRAETGSASRAPDPAAPAGGNDFRPLILIVDDNADMREHLMHLLQPHYRVLAVSDGAAALEIIYGSQPDLILSDVMMPRLDGFGLVRALRNDPALRTTPIILLSARAGEGSRIEGFEEGADDYLEKPFSSRELLARLRTHLELVRLRREREEAVSNLARQFRTLVDRAPIGIYLIDSDFRIAAVNPVAEPVFGKIPNLIGRDFAEVLRLIWPREFADEVVSIFRHTLETGASYSDPEKAEKRLDRGVVEYYEWRVDRIPLPDGKHGAVCYFREISAQVAARDKLQEAARRLALVTNTAPVYLAQIDRETRYTFVNELYTRRFGLKPADCLGKRIVDVLGEKAYASFATQVETVLSGQSIDFETEIPYSTGARYMHASYRPEFDADQQVVGFVAAITDITDRRRAELAIAAAKDQAEAANRAKDDFLAALSHELRTPLTPVLMCARALIEDARLPEDVREQLTMMARNIGLEARLIDDLLDLTRITKGKLQLKAEPCDVHALIMHVAEMVREEAREKGMNLELHLRAAGNQVHGDPTRLQQVFWNLLKNAVKFTPAGGRVSVETSDEGGRLVIEVRDTGVGFSPSMAEHIFAPFEQGGMNYAHKFGGLGLGLAIARAIVNLHEGSISAMSSGRNRGASFVVRLPGGGAAAGAPAESSQREGAVEEKQAPLRLLVVEDHLATAVVLTRLLERAGHEVATAHDVSEALEAAKNGEFDIVISDLGLPDGSGIELMPQLRALHPSLRGIALSGYGMEDDVRKSLEAGFAAHLTKPIDFDVLRRNLDRLAGPRVGME